MSCAHAIICGKYRLPKIGWLCYVINGLRREMGAEPIDLAA